ncbi:MAG: Holliday junction resolvase RuvX [Holophagales bacterium]|nr:MAG: Holliday junction resolvase RuvX [Holophagales bacterium]
MLAQGVAANGPRTGRRALAVDLGERRVGLAITDPEGRFALPLSVLARRSDREVIGAIRDIAAAEQVALLVVGEPRGPGGTSGSAAERARRFGERLGRAAALPCIFVDETLTTVEAEARRVATSTTALRRRRDERIDALAAQVILQEAIERGLLRPQP